MLGFIRKILRFWAQNQDDEQPLSTSSGDEIRPELEMNLAYLREQLGRSPDVIIRRFTLGGPGKIGATLVFIDGLTDKTIINQDILRPLMIEKEKTRLNRGTDQSSKSSRNVWSPPVRSKEPPTVLI